MIRPIFVLPSNPNAPLTWLNGRSFENSQTLYKKCPLTYSKSLYMNVFFMSKPQAMISLAFCSPNLCVSSNDSPSLKSAFSSSVNMITIPSSAQLPKAIGGWEIPNGTSNTSCNHFVNVNGMVCPKCSASLDGPRPVYKKNGSPASYRSRILSKSRCEKNKPRRNQRCGFFPVSRSNRCRRSSSISFVAHFLLYCQQVGLGKVEWEEGKATVKSQHSRTAACFLARLARLARPRG
jgi:hypothetical protein